MNNDHHTLGKFCSVAKQNTIIMPKKINGYKEPEGQILKENGQKINFIYTPIEYKIMYDLAGGVVDFDLKNSYTIEDPTYTPGNPTREGYHFNGWEPKNIPNGSIGNIKMIATWIANPIFITGKKLNNALGKLAGNKADISSIVIVDHKLDYDFCNVSSTSTPIIAYYSNRVIYLYSEYPIWCNINMDHAFDGFKILKNIECLKNIHCNPGTSIKYLFNDCTLLSRVDPVENWANGEFSSFIGAFSGTIAMNSGRVPSWYKWHETIIHKSTTGKILEIVEEDKIPGEVIYGKSFNGYKADSKPVFVTSPNSELVFEYTPIEYTITYFLNGGKIFNAKTKYTIEDETYYPPEPVKPGYKFIGWDHECIISGDNGNIIFIAQYEIK